MLSASLCHLLLIIRPGTFPLPQTTVKLITVLWRVTCHMSHTLPHDMSPCHTPQLPVTLTVNPVLLSHNNILEGWWHSHPSSWSLYWACLKCPLSSFKPFKVSRKPTLRMEWNVKHFALVSHILGRASQLHWLALHLKMITLDFRCIKLTSTVHVEGKCTYRSSYTGRGRPKHG